MFIGEYRYSIDNKGRVVLPPDFRALLKGKIFIIKGFEKCLFVYDEDEWAVQQKRYSGLSDFGEKARKLKRLIFSGMIDVSLDKQGRVKISQPLLQYAGINKEVVVVGVNNKIEIWAKEKWDEFLGDNEDQIELLAEELDSKLQDQD